MTLVLVIASGVLGVLVGILIGAGLVTWIARKSGLVP